MSHKLARNTDDKLRMLYETTLGDWVVVGGGVGQTTLGGWVVVGGGVGVVVV